MHTLHILGSIASKVGGTHDPGLHLVMAGPAPRWGVTLTEIGKRAGIAHHVHWPGMIKGIAKTGAFVLCEAFTLPSHQENFGTAVVAALAVGRPILRVFESNAAGSN